MMASFSVFGCDLPSIAFIVLHSLDGSVLCSSVSINCLNVFLRCSFVVLVISSFICCRAGGRGGISGSQSFSCCHPFQYFCWDRFCINTVVYVVVLPSESWYARYFLLFGSLLAVVFCSVCLLSPYAIGPSLPSLS